MHWPCRPALAAARRRLGLRGRCRCGGPRQSPRNELARNLGFGHREIEPPPNILIQPDAVHEVVDRLLQAHAQRVVVDPGRVAEADVVLGEAAVRPGVGQRLQRHAVALRVQPDR